MIRKHTEALHNFVAMLGPKARVSDPDKLLTGLAGMGISFDGSDEPIVGSLPSATAADLRDNTVSLRLNHARIHDYERRASWPLHDVDAELRAIGFCVARLK
ncbi:MAG: hypothetical protein GEU95_01130 [Rhizobiales bacterium]|nr:hypothetical protein [Hyphomicrobiales bacterium]